MVEEHEAVFGGEDTEGGGEAIGGDGAVGDDRDQGVVSEAEAGVRVDDMGVALAVQFNELEEVTGGGDRFIFDQEEF